MTTAPANTLFDAILDFLASSPSAAELIAYTPPDALQERLSALLERNRQQGLSPQEQAELQEFFQMDRLMSRLKIRAHLKVSGG